MSKKNYPPLAADHCASSEGHPAAALLSSPPATYRSVTLGWIWSGGGVLPTCNIYHLQLSNPDSNLSKDSQCLTSRDFSSPVGNTQLRWRLWLAGPPIGDWRPSGEQLDENGQLSWLIVGAALGEQLTNSSQVICLGGGGACLALPWPNWAEVKASNVNSSSTLLSNANCQGNTLGFHCRLFIKQLFAFLLTPRNAKTNTQGIPTQHQKATDTPMKHISCTTEQVITGHVTGDLTAVLSNQIKFIIFSMSSMFGPWTPILQGVWLWEMRKQDEVKSLSHTLCGWKALLILRPQMFFPTWELWREMSTKIIWHLGWLAGSGICDWLMIRYWSRWVMKKGASALKQASKIR